MLRPALIRVVHENGETSCFYGFVVPNTKWRLSIDRRDEPASRYIITHRPTGYCLMPRLTGPLDTKTRALDVAQRFYAEFEKRGWSLADQDPKALVAPFQTLTDDEKRAFRKAVRGET